MPVRSYLLVSTLEKLPLRLGEYVKYSKQAKHTDNSVHRTDVLLALPASCSQCQCLTSSSVGALLTVLVLC
jgi:hypothetical protein